MSDIKWKTDEPAEPFSTEAKIDGFHVRVNRYGGWNVFCRLNGMDIMASGGGGMFQRGFEKGKEQATAAVEKLKSMGATGR